MFLKTKDKSVKELAGPAALSAVLAGITEPAIYGVTLRFKRPFFIGAVFSGIAGAIVAAAGTGPAALSAVLAGITEPAIYGVTLRFKRPFFIGAVFSGIAGAIVAAAGTGAPTLLGTSILTLPGYIGVGFVGFLIACAIAYFGSAIVTYFFGYSISASDLSDF